MAGGKLPPRQKMIGMMYLVLTALLAMNVSKEVLNSFVVINSGLETTNSNFSQKNAYTYDAFDKAKMNDPEKVMRWWQKAQTVREASNEVYDHIEELKREVIRATASYTEETPDSMYWLRNVESKDNYDVPTQIMIGEPALPKEGEWTAHELRTKIEGYTAKLTELFDPERDKQTIAAIEASLELKPVPIPGGGQETWANGNFYHLPLAAVVTNLSKIQADIRNAEADVIKELLSNISAADFKFDTLAAKVIPNTNYVILGDTYRADVFVAAFASTKDPKLLVGEIDTTADVPNVLNPDTAGVSYNRGMATYKFVPNTEGEIEWGGVIQIEGPDGSMSPYKFSSKFMAAKPTLVVSPTAMNVFYRGLDNPVDISVPGIATELLKPSCTNGSITPAGKKGSYIVRPGKGQKAVISVSAEVNGENKNFGEMEFRCKNVPSPEPYFGGITGSGNIPKAKLMAATGVSAKMENFEFDLKFVVTEFSISMNYKGNLVEQKARGNKVNADMKNLLKAAKKGQKIFIEGIQAKGPDGSIRKLGAISLKVL